MEFEKLLDLAKKGDKGAQKELFLMTVLFCGNGPARLENSMRICFRNCHWFF